MPVGRGGLRSGVLLLAGSASFPFYRVAVGLPDAVAGWLVGVVVIVQGAVMAWLAAVDWPVRSRTLLAAAVAAVLTVALQLGLPARPFGLTIGGIFHAAAYCGLLIWFARSLQAGRDPVVTELARRIRRTMPDQVVRYTRRVTFAWCGFFAAQLVASATLLVLAPITLWASFVTLWNLPLIVAMALAEVGCRLLLFRHEAQTGLIATLIGMRRMRGLFGSLP